MAKIKGLNWGVFGAMDTGKTYQTIKVALQLQKLYHKPIIIYDHSSNESYEEYQNIVPIERLRYPFKNDEIVKVQSDDFDLFCEYGTHYIRESILVLDDSGIFFNGNFPKNREQFIKSAKNNSNDIFYQTHSFREVGPGLLDNLQMVILKEIAQKNIPDKVAWKQHIEILLYEVCKENDKRPEGELYSYRIYNISKHLVYKEDKNQNLIEYQGRDYFKKYEKESKFK